MNTLASPSITAPGEPTASRPAASSAWQRRLPLSVAIAALFGWLLWSVSARQALLLLVGVGLGATLAAARFGFTTGWRVLVEKRDPSGVYGQIVLLALLAALSMPIVAHYAETTAALGPLSVSLLVGAFVFGLCMQVADGCGSGQLYKAGLGLPLNMAILPMFVLGSFAGSVQLGDWLALGALPAVGLVQRWGAGGALAATLAGLAVVTWLVGRWSGQPFDPRRIPRRWLWGALALALLATLNLFIAGQPWGIVYGMGVWGAKAVAALGWDLSADAFWGVAPHAQRLVDPILADVTSVTNIGLIYGAIAASRWNGAADFSLPSGKRLIAAAIAGLVMGYSARMAFGCNVGAYLGGIASASVHGWVWFALAFAGSIVGVRIRRRVDA